MANMLFLITYIGCLVVYPGEFNVFFSFSDFDPIFQRGSEKMYRKKRSGLDDVVPVFVQEDHHEVAHHLMRCVGAGRIPGMLI